MKKLYKAVPCTVSLPRRDTNTDVRIRVTIVPVQIQLAIIRVHVANDRVAVYIFVLQHRFDNDCSQAEVFL